MYVQSEIYLVALNSWIIFSLIKKIASSDRETYIIYCDIYSKKSWLRFNIIMITVLLEYRLRLWLPLPLDYDYNHDYTISKNMITIMIMCNVID